LTVIRPAIAADVPQLLAFLTAMAAEAGETVGSTKASLLAAGFGPAPRFYALIAEDGRGPLGMILYFAEYSTWRGEMGLFVQDIYVSPLARGTGLARRLMGQAMAQADWQPRFLTLMVAHDNPGARAFYTRLGMGLRDTADQLILEGQGLRALTEA
jgi:ribosomal protein S18 acetylase RimI-like enzyme